MDLLRYRVETARAALGLSRADLARRLGWPTGYLNQRLSGYIPFSRIDYAYYLALALETAPEPFVEAWVHDQLERRGLLAVVNVQHLTTETA